MKNSVAEVWPSAGGFRRTGRRQLHFQASAVTHLRRLQPPSWTVAATNPALRWSIYEQTIIILKEKERPALARIKPSLSVFLLASQCSAKTLSVLNIMAAPTYYLHYEAIPTNRSLYNRQRMALLTSQFAPPPMAERLNAWVIRGQSRVALSWRTESRGRFNLHHAYGATKSFSVAFASPENFSMDHSGLSFGDRGAAKPPAGTPIARSNEYRNHSVTARSAHTWVIRVSKNLDTFRKGTTMKR